MKRSQSAHPCGHHARVGFYSILSRKRKRYSRARSNHHGRSLRNFSPRNSLWVSVYRSTRTASKRDGVKTTFDYRQ